jgi:xanthine dehydrogenase accessory factor
VTAPGTAPELIERLLEATQRAEPVVLATIVGASGDTTLRVGAKLLIHADGTYTGSFGDEHESAELARVVAGDALRLLAAGRLEVLTYALAPVRPGLEPATLEVAVEPFVPRPSVVILGAGHIAVALARVCALLGHALTVIDDRPEYACHERFPDADRVVVADFAAALDQLEVTPATYFVLVTRGHKLDYLCLRKIIQTHPVYIGMIGSRRRVRAALQALLREGVPADQLRRLHAPIGLDIGADSPEEIAVSVAAEMIKVCRGGKAASMSESVDVERLTGEELLPTWNGRP